MFPQILVDDWFEAPVADANNVGSYNPLTTTPKFNSSPPENDGWKTILSFWDGKFSGANS